MTPSDPPATATAFTPSDSLPWLRFYDAVPPALRYPEGSLSDAVLATASRVPDAPALTFQGATTTYTQLGLAIERCAAAFAGLGLRAGDRITIAMPTSPQGVIAFYAANRLGAVAVMVHPLCTPPEIEFYLSASRSRFALTLDFFYPKFAAVRANTGLEQLIVTRITDTLGPLQRLGYLLTRWRTAPAIPRDPTIQWWRSLMAQAWPPAPSPSSMASGWACASTPCC
jgi:long-chain acyl-CoA synthetase